MYARPICAGGASGALPYESDTFDLVIFNYVLEWSAGRTSVKPEKFHADLLAEIQRVLRPGGRLYVSTKNRFAIRYVLGSEDEHFGYRFGGALPRWVTRKFASSNYLDIPGGYLHSRRGIEKLLREAGFSDLQAILFFPTQDFRSLSRILTQLGSLNWARQNWKVFRARRKSIWRFLRR